MQGRVMALHQMALFGTAPIGALGIGWVIQATSPRVPFALGGLTALACAVAVHHHCRTRPHSASAPSPATTDRASAHRTPIAPTPALSSPLTRK
jgi:hypothetical protein